MTMRLGSISYQGYTIVCWKAQGYPWRCQVRSCDDSLVRLVSPQQNYLYSCKDTILKEGIVPMRNLRKQFPSSGGWKWHVRHVLLSPFFIPHLVCHVLTWINSIAKTCTRQGTYDMQQKFLSQLLLHRFCLLKLLIAMKGSPSGYLPRQSQVPVDHNVFVTLSKNEKQINQSFREDMIFYLQKN